METRTTLEEATHGDGPSSWVDPATGIRERAGFHGEPGERIFGVSYEPLRPAIAGFVICCPFQAEMLRNYRREVLLARSLAAEGFAVQRFHYRGSGHSEGDGSMTLDSMLEDAATARNVLTATTGAHPVGFVGARLGGMIAAHAAAQVGAPVVLWEPVVDPARYFDEILRFRLVREMGVEGSTITEAGLRDEMRRAGFVDILGHPVERALYDSVSSTHLDPAGNGLRAALLLQMAPGRTLRRAYETLAKSWRERGVDVATDVVTDREAWWLSGDMWPVHETHAPTAKLIATTVGWIRSVLASETSS